MQAVKIKNQSTALEKNKILKFTAEKRHNSWNPFYNIKLSNIYLGHSSQHLFTENFFKLTTNEE